ncbi:GNAT family N-acetyltransferase [Rhizobiales bacterium RZME27]|uniref:GNAT family N-acetyltransferase n=1 Tax=Endobacterium cereale TaxID=2663029 RepID=A0A6A8AAU4_9HYPH|nr:GNAT family protein [Endobacterium cereale]MEB2846111.1 GNAT family protein [Endobacterium cereale]MQY48322.1 GNAT family N-acetyltransferase [Endobacterium cereale]
MNLQSLPNSITTTRLILRKFQTDDLTAYAAYRSRNDVYRYLYAAPSTGAALEEKFAKLLEAPFENDGDDFRLAVTRKEDGALVGDVMLKLANKAALQAEVGYVFHPDYGGKGYATEAVSAMISAGFETFGFHRIFARLDSRNNGSVGIVKRLGLRREAHLIENDRFNGEWGDEYVYAVLARDWTAAQRGDEA